MSLLVTLAAPHDAGVLATLTAALPAEAEILDLTQTDLLGRVSASLLVRVDDEPGTSRALSTAGDRIGAQVRVESIPDPTSFNAAPDADPLVVTVLAAPLQGPQLTSVLAAIETAGGRIERSRRLSSQPYTCLELRVGGVALEVLRPTLATVAADSGVDIAVAPAGLARHGRRLLVMDVDSTLIQQEVIELLAAHAGREAEVRAVTERAMRGELDFAASLTERVRTLAGLPVAVLDEVREAVRLTPGARTLVSTVRSMGMSVGVVSGGFLEVVVPLAAELGITHVHANRLEVAEGYLTGRVNGAIVDRATKAAKLREWAASEGLPLHRTIAVGDGANDLDMLAEAGLGIAFNAKPAVRAAAHTALNQPRLDAVLQLMGLGSDEIGPDLG